MTDKEKNCRTEERGKGKRKAYAKLVATVRKARYGGRMKDTWKVQTMGIQKKPV